MTPLGGAPAMERAAAPQPLRSEVVLKDNRVEQRGRSTPLPESLIKLQGVERAQSLRKWNAEHQNPRDAFKLEQKPTPPLSDCRARST